MFRLRLTSTHGTEGKCLNTEIVPNSDLDYLKNAALKDLQGVDEPTAAIVFKLNLCKKFRFRTQSRNLRKIALRTHTLFVNS